MKETVDIYKVNKVRRIEALVKKAGVALQEYEEALSFTNEGYKVVIERDLTEIFVNTSLSAPGALAHRLQHRTTWKIQNGARGPQNGRRGLKRGPTLGYWPF